MDVLALGIVKRTRINVLESIGDVFRLNGKLLIDRYGGGATKTTWVSVSHIKHDIQHPSHIDPAWNPSFRFL